MRRCNQRMIYGVVAIDSATQLMSLGNPISLYINFPQHYLLEFLTTKSFAFMFWIIQPDYSRTAIYQPRRAKTAKQVFYLKKNIWTLCSCVRPSLFLSFFLASFLSERLLLKEISFISDYRNNNISIKIIRN